MMLKDKVAVIYGAGGAIGGAIARAFASEGAKVFLTGCSPASVEVVAKDIVSPGGFAEAAEVDALDRGGDHDRHRNAFEDGHPIRGRRGLDPRGPGKHGGLRGFRRGERDDRNGRQPEHGEPGRLVVH
jgi:NAD(P)-dependent dehydrogenase (short-subunit alcohol dehydrogenase family)